VEVDNIARRVPLSDFSNPFRFKNLARFSKHKATEVIGMMSSTSFHSRESL
jgi:hypothetical protein